MPQNTYLPILPNACNISVPLLPPLLLIDELLLLLLLLLLLFFPLGLLLTPKLLPMMEEVVLKNRS